MKAFSWRRSNWLTTLSMAGITAGFVAVFFMPEMKTMRQAQEEIRAKDLASAQEPALISAAQAAAKERDETAAFLADWASHSPNGGQVSKLYARISQLAGKSHSAITRFEPGTPVEYQGLRQLPLSLSCEGTFGGCLQFLAEVERLPQTIWVEEAKFERTAEAGKNLQCDMVLAIFADKSEISD